MTRQVNFTTVELMTEPEAMQIARKNILFIEQIRYMIHDLMANQCVTFGQARREALETLEIEGVEFIFRPKFEGKITLGECLSMCFPELSAKSREGIFKWKLKKERKLNRSNRKNPGWNLMGQVEQRVLKCLPLPKVKIDLNEELPEEWCNLSKNVVEKGKLLSYAFGSKARRKYQAREFYPKGIFYSFFSEQHARAHRSRNRSVKKKSGGDDGGGDGDPDSPDEPPRPSYKGRLIPPAPVQARLIPLTHKTNSFSSSRTPLPCRWSVLGRWAA